MDLSTPIAHTHKLLGDEDYVEALPGLRLLRAHAPTRLESTLYDPVVCLILQGRKETTLGGRALGFGPGESLLVSHDLPVVSRICEASRERPYLAVVLALDLALLRSLYDEVAQADLMVVSSQAAVVSPADPALLDTVGRYLAAASDPLEARVVGPLVRRELHFRLLLAPHGGMLRELLRHDSHASQIARAIGRIRREFRARLTVADLARTAGMSASSFHKHFKDITASTPLQYQKELRLLEARRLLTSAGHSVSEAAFEVGYESPTQFSREYTRKFGITPSADARAA